MMCDEAHEIPSKAMYFTEMSTYFAQLDAKLLGLVMAFGTIQLICVLLIVHRRTKPAVSGYVAMLAPACDCMTRVTLLLAD
jgi:hypothetical protein